MKHYLPVRRASVPDPSAAKIDSAPAAEGSPVRLGPLPPRAVFLLGEHPTREQAQAVREAIASWLTEWAMLTTASTSIEVLLEMYRASPSSDILLALAASVRDGQRFTLRRYGPRKPPASLPVEAACETDDATLN